MAWMKRASLGSSAVVLVQVEPAVVGDEPSEVVVDHDLQVFRAGEVGDQFRMSL